MGLYKNKYRTSSHRHRYWDYSWPGVYFITICTQDRACILGHISQGHMALSPSGHIVQQEMMRIPTYHDHVRMDTYVVMPNHVHMMVEIIGDWGDAGNRDDGVEKIHEFSLRRRQRQRPQPHRQRPQPQPQRQPHRQPSSPWWRDPNHHPTIDQIKQYRKQRRQMIIPKLIGKFKMLTSKQINVIHDTPKRKNWQSNYHDHIVRSEASYQRVKRYINNNVSNWEKDKLYD